MYVTTPVKYSVGDIVYCFPYLSKFEVIFVEVSISGTFYAIRPAVPSDPRLIKPSVSQWRLLISSPVSPRLSVLPIGTSVIYRDTSYTIQNVSICSASSLGVNYTLSKGDYTTTVFNSQLREAIIPII